MERSAIVMSKSGLASSKSGGAGHFTAIYKEERTFYLWFYGVGHKRGDPWPNVE